MMIAWRAFTLAILTVLLFAATLLSFMFDHPVHAILAIAAYLLFGAYMVATIPRVQSSHRC